jgi:hypothetical protein
MRDDRPAMSHPRATLLILVLAAQAAGLFTTGCNPDTRELLLDPRLPIAEPYAGGTWTTSPVLTCGRATNALTAWSRDDVLMVGATGLAVRVQGGVARNVDAPVLSGLLAAVAQPDGKALVSTADGVLYCLEGNAWSVEYRPNIRVLGMWRSGDGVVIGVGSGGLGVRRASGGAWELFNTGAGETLLGLWGRSVDDCWAVGDGGVVAHYSSGTWSVERPFGDDVRLEKYIAGEADGRVAVVGSGTVRLREDEAWQALLPFPSGSRARGVAFVGGQLLAWDSRRIYRWDGAAWIFLVEHGSGPTSAIVVDDALLFARSEGGLARLENGQVETLLPQLGAVADLETTPDGMAILTTTNWIIRGAGADWQPEARLTESVFYNDNGGRRLVRSGAGELTALAGTLYRESAAGWEPLTQAMGDFYSSLFPLGDGTLLLSNSTGLWTVSGDRRVFLCDPPEDWWSLLSVVGHSAADAHYLFPHFLAIYDGVTLQSGADRLQGEAWCLGQDPTEGLLLLGRQGLFAVDGATMLDVTPRCEVGGSPVRAVILDFAITPAGNWLAWTDSGRLLQRRAGRWQSLDGASGFPLSYAYPVVPGRSIRVGEGGDIWLFSKSCVFHYRDAAP